MNEYQENGRGFSSDEEAWAVLKRQLEIAKKPVQAAEKLHKEMWDAVAEGNGDGFLILVNELKHTASNAVTFWLEVERLARIAVGGEGWNGEDDGQTDA